MTRPIAIATITLLTASVAAAQTPAPQKISLAEGLQRSYAGIKRNLTEMAENMPEAHYTFQATEGVRTFGQLMGHAANSQFNTCAAALGVPNPNQGTNNEEKANKAEFVKALAASFALCDKAFDALTDTSAVALVTQGRNEVARGAALAGVIAHSNEVYGNAIPYMRLKGLVPPSTERSQQMRKPGQ